MSVAKRGIDRAELDQDLLAEIRQFVAQKSGQRAQDVTDAQIDEYMALWLADDLDAADDQSVSVIFEQQVANNPAHPALILPLGHQSMSYQMLSRCAAYVARCLQEHAVGPGACVAICVERSFELVIGLLGILKAGAAFVPLDPSDSPRYRADVLSTAGVSAVLTKERFRREFDTYECPILSLDLDWPTIAEENQQSAHVEIDLGSLAYLNQVSGQLIPVTHHSILSCIWWLQHEFALSPSDTVLHTAAVTSDALVHEILWPLTCGACVVLTPHNTTASLQRIIGEQRVSIAHLTPSMLALLLGPATAPLPELRAVICYGALLAPSVVDAFLQQHGVGLYHRFTVPEVASDIALLEYRLDAQAAFQPIDHTPDTLVLYILDQYRQPVPIGVTGELFVAGSAVAEGQRLTLDESVSHHITSDFHIPGLDRLLKTNEKARWLNDGGLELLGPVGPNIWIDGRRINIRQIETALLEHTLVTEAVVLTRQTIASTLELVAYTAGPGRADPNDLRTYLQDRLPTTLLPQVYVPLGAIPRLEDGSLDEQALAQAETLAQTLPLVVVASFTGDLLSDSLTFWMEKLGIPCSIQFAPYGQVFQQLLDPASLIATNQRGANLILVRVEDWAGASDSWDDQCRDQLTQNVQDFIKLLQTGQIAQQGLCIVCLCPPSDQVATGYARAQYLAEMYMAIEQGVSAIERCICISYLDVIATYQVEQWSDPLADQLGRIPYTSAFFAALGTAIVRRIALALGIYPSVIAVDADGSLWSPQSDARLADETTVTLAQRLLQRYLVSQKRVGRKLWLWSARPQEEIDHLLAGDGELPLRRSHIDVWAGPGRAVAQLLALTTQHGTSLGSVAFLTHNPQTYQEVQDYLPDILALQLPTDDVELAHVLRHLWILDT